MAKKKGGGKPAGPPGGGGGGKKSGGKGGVSTIILSALITIIAGIILLSWFAEKLPPRFMPHAPVARESFREVSLYFSNAEGIYLKAENRRIKKGPLDSELRDALEALLDGPLGGLGRAIPEGTRLRSVKVKDKTAVVDLSKEIIEKHPGGSTGEIQTIYSIVDTVTLNFPEIKDVQILVEGKKEATIAGHIDISYPLTADRTVIRG